MSEEERKFLEIVDLKKGFGSGETRQEVLRGMNFSVTKGEFCVLLGPSGSGKSTLLNIIGGIDSADSGYISINGDKLKDMSDVCIKAPQTETYMIQELHLPIYHCLCLMLENRFFA